ncbi:oxidoreductase [Anaerotignum sp.]|uniref:oxidoreductase n=1 Tax=Anaerotignum sp. TaxID=2039241 RepID=UPI0027147CCA|nr:FAD-dependent oxidoreductase [Anaerotignum sp.]
MLYLIYKSWSISRSKNLEYLFIWLAYYGVYQRKGWEFMLYSSLKIRGMELKNRWIMLAMHTGYGQGNAFSDREFAFYEERAKGGAAAITLVLAVNEAGALKGMHQAKKIEVESLKELVRRVHQHGCKVIVQLFHCGRNESKKDHGERPLVAPSPVSSLIFKNEPIKIDEIQLTSTKEDFALAGVLCKNVGVDAIEISASAGYLLSEFLSPITNLREDVYGYGTNKGMEYPLEVIQTVREKVGDFPILLKVSGAQMVDGGYGLEDTVSFCRLAEKYIDGVTVTGGWHESPIDQISYHVTKGAYAPFAGAVKKYVSLPVIACNRIHDGETAERLLADNQCDFVGSARAFLADPQFANRVESKERFLPCQGCNCCISRVLKGQELACGFNPEAGQEYFENQRRKIATRKEVVVVGGGPAGMEAAKKAAERGFITTLITEEDVLGGQFNLAAKPPQKEGISEYIAYMEEVLKHLGVAIVFREKCSEELLLEKKPYFTVIATGSKPTRAEITGSEKGFFANDILSGKIPLPPQSEDGQIVIIGGGSFGLETAAYIKQQEEGRKIKIIEKEATFGKHLGALARPLLSNLRGKGVQFMANTSADALEDGKVLISIAGKKFFLQADAIIWAVGVEPQEYAYLTLPLMDERLSYALVGDADKIGKGTDAIHSSYELFTRVYLA